MDDESSEGLKKMAAASACRLVEQGMSLGVGSGSTVACFIEELGRRKREEGLEVTCVPTSRSTEKALKELGICVKGIDEAGRIDLTVDGADAVDAQLNGLKGLGGALLWEKVVAQNSDRYIWIVDESKMQETLSGKVCLEAVRFGSEKLLKKLEDLGLHPRLRKKRGMPVLSDGCNYIIELDVGKIEDPRILARSLKQMTGIIEHGLFLQMADEVFVAKRKGVEIIKKQKKPSFDGFCPTCAGAWSS